MSMDAQGMLYVASTAATHSEPLVPAQRDQLVPEPTALCRCGEWQERMRIASSPQRDHSAKCSKESQICL